MTGAGDQTQAGEACEAARIEAQARQFEVYVRMAEAISDRKATITRYYLGLNTAVIAASGYAVVDIVKSNGVDPTTLAGMAVFGVFVALIGLRFSRLWENALEQQSAWEHLKYKVIREMEEREDTALAPLYAEEWREYKKLKRDEKIDRMSLTETFSLFYRICAVVLAVVAAVALSRI